MKTLKESLFDSDLISRDLTLGDIFKFIPEYSVVSAKYYISGGKNVPITDCVDVKSLKRDTNVSGSDNKVIENGFAKLFSDIKFIPGYYTSSELRREYKELVNKYLYFDRYEGKNYIIMNFYKNNSKFSNFSKIDDSKEVNMIVVNIGGSIILRFDRI